MSEKKIFCFVGSMQNTMDFKATYGTNISREAGCVLLCRWDAEYYDF